MNLPHPAMVSSGPQLDSVIAELEAGTYPQTDGPIWRPDVPVEQAIRLARATGATEEMIRDATAREWSDEPIGLSPAATLEWLTSGGKLSGESAIEAMDQAANANGRQQEYEVTDTGNKTVHFTLMFCHDQTYYIGQVRYYTINGRTFRIATDHRFWSTNLWIMPVNCTDLASGQNAQALIPADTPNMLATPEVRDAIAAAYVNATGQMLTAEEKEGIH